VNSDILERMARLGWSCVALLVIGLAAVPVAARGNDAKEFYEQATAAFGLGHYAEAAEKYEQAFSRRPDPALLYNAAQAYRLAGNKQRALELYTNCVRLFPNFPNAEDARNHIATLRRELEDQQAAPAPVVTAPAPGAAASAPPPVAAATTPAPVVPAPVSPTAAPAPVLVDAPAATVTASAPPAEASESVFSKPWFWGVVAAVVVGGTVGIVLATRGTKYPDASFGMVNGN
jgi:tetratricopeptide (TPR) repeat protein